MTTKIDLEELERKATSATPGPWRVSKSDPAEYVSVLYDDNTGGSYEVCDECMPDNAQHIAANSPPVTLALVARIRKLEAALERSLACHRDAIGFTPTSSIGLRAVLEEGAVIA